VNCRDQCETGERWNAPVPRGTRPSALLLKGQGQHIAPVREAEVATLHGG
jgi:hypothetical protein